jgi:hypothetical protein
VPGKVNPANFACRRVEALEEVSGNPNRRRMVWPGARLGKALRASDYSASTRNSGLRELETFALLLGREPDAQDPAKKQEMKLLSKISELLFIIEYTNAQGEALSISLPFAHNSRMLALENQDPREELPKHRPLQPA